MTEAGSDPIPMPGTDRQSFDIGVLSEQVRQAHETLREQRDAYAADKLAADLLLQQKAEEIERRNRRRKWAIVFAAIVGSAGLALGVVSYTAIRRSDAERAERTVTACEQQAGFATAHNGLVRADQATLEDFDPVRAAEYEAQIVRVRDCTEAGIATYNATHGDEGYLP